MTAKIIKESKAMTRKEEIKNSIHSFSNENGYTKKEYLSELLSLQKEKKLG